MPRGGRLTISTSLEHIDASGREKDLPPGDYMALSIMHSGVSHAGGSNQDSAVKLLADAVRGMMENANGMIRVSRIPQGTDINLLFPAIADVAPENADLGEFESATTGRTILILEDDDAVRLPAAEFLIMQGFKVLQASTGEEALNVVQRSRSQLELLITDVVMPKMSGPEIAAKLLEAHPDLKVLYMSGDVSSVKKGARLGQQRVLQKPFRLDRLNQEIRDLLGQ